MLIKPKPEVVDQSYIKDYENLYQEVRKDPESFWENIAHELSWFKPWNKVLDWNYPYARWFVGGQCNIIHNALDRWQKMTAPNFINVVRQNQNDNSPPLMKDKLAYIWQGQPTAGESASGKEGPVRTFTYGQLNTEVSKFANVLKTLGVRKGDRVTIYLPRIPEQFIAMLSCAKIGAIHSVVFSGFSADALKNRIMDAQAKIVITTDKYPYKDKIIDSQKTVEEAIREIKSVEHVILVERIKQTVDSQDPSSTLNPLSSSYPYYHWYHELMAKADTICSTEIMEATDPLFLLYTSGSTGKPKGVLHSHAGYMVGIYTTLKWIFNLQSDDIYFCTADAGWITGHSYIVYSPLMNGATTFVYEGTPDYPHPGIWWELIQKYNVSIFYTAPTAIRAMMRLGEEIPEKYDLSSLKILGTVGEPINPEAWLWYYKTIGKEKCPIMDTWWQTETGMIMLTPLPSVALKPGSCFKPFFGVEADVVDEHGNSLQLEPAANNSNQPRMTKQGYLVIKKPWPAMLLDVYNNPQKYKETYFEKIQVSRKLEVGSEKLEEKSQFSNLQPPTSNNFSDFLYFTGDSAKKDEDGYFWIIGRNDDVIKVSGHRLGSAELESAFVSHPSVAEAAVIGKPHEVKGESIKAFVILKVDQKPTDQLKEELVKHVRNMIGPIATPDEIQFVEKLPKTRSGKIMRRVLKAQELGQPLGDTSTLEN